MPAKLDARLNAYRQDLADVRLEGKVKAARYVAGEIRQVAVPSVALKALPSLSEGLENEVLFGERVRVFDEDDAWAWCQLERDGYVGYVAVESLRQEIHVPTHRVSALGTFVYPEPDIKSAPLMHLSINAELTIVEQQDRFLSLATGGWVISRHTSEVGRFALDFVEIAERFIGTPYLWGGRTRLGVDCSGLLQIAMEAAGQSCPRDTDMQQRSVGAELLVRPDFDGLRRRDLVFWPRHVGIMVDGVMMLHANAHHMAVAVEPLADAVERTARAGSQVACVRRPGARERRPGG